LNPWQLDERQRQILLANQDALWADEVLRARGSTLTPESVRSLTLLATDDPLAADQAFAERVLEQLKAESAPHER